MLYLGIDQHAKQLTVCVRNAAGDTVFRRQVSTRREKVRAFFEQLTAMDSQFMAILEVCGFNDWLIANCTSGTARRWCSSIQKSLPRRRQIDVMRKKLSDLLWLNRGRLAAGEPVHGLRRVYIVSQQERENRQLTALRQTLGQRRTRTINKIHRILNRHNLMWDYPTKSFQTVTGRRWLEKIKLPEIDRLEMDMLLVAWETWNQQIAQIEEKIAKRASQRDQDNVLSATEILMTAPGVSYYSGLTLASRIGPVGTIPASPQLGQLFRPDAWLP